jgi:hypothetical protein
MGGHRLILRAIRTSAIVVLVVILAVSSAQNAFASILLSYDSDTIGFLWDASRFVGVRFSLPSGVPSARLLSVLFAWAALDDLTGGGMVMALRPTADGVNDVTIYIAGSDHQTLLTPAFTVTADAGWNTEDVSGLGIVVSGDFYVILESVIPASPVVDNSGSNTDGRSVYGDSLAGLTAPCCDGSSGNFMIRATINQIGPVAPIGGFLEPASKLLVAAPYLALLGLVAAIAVVAVAPWNRRKS